MSGEFSLSVSVTAPAAGRAVSATPPLRLPGSGAATASPDSATPHGSEAPRDILSRAAQRVADSLGGGNSFAFSVDHQTGMTIVRVINKATGELIRQIPSEEVVHIAQLLSQDEQHKLLDVRA